MGMVFGFKLHALTNLDGLFARWAFAAAHHTDVRLARELTDPESPSLGLEDPESPSLGVDSGRQSLYRHRRADTEAIKHDPESPSLRE